MYIKCIGRCIFSEHQKKGIDVLVHSFLRLFARAQSPCVIVSSSSTTYILDSAGTRIGFVKRSYKDGRMYTSLRIIKQCLPTVTILNSLILHHKPTYVTSTVNVYISFFFFFFFCFSDSSHLLSYHEIDPRPTNLFLSLSPSF
jgi:hypothetical protein